jgi:hypothetical protein
MSKVWPDPHLSPEAALWIRRCQVHHSLLRLHAGRKRNRGNLIQAAQQSNIIAPLSIIIPVEDLRTGLEFCRSNVVTPTSGESILTKHLNERLEAAKERDTYKEAKKNINVTIWLKTPLCAKEYCGVTLGTPPHFLLPRRCLTGHTPSRLTWMRQPMCCMSLLHIYIAWTPTEMLDKWSLRDARKDALSLARV